MIYVFYGFYKNFQRLADQGIKTVGLDIALIALQQVFTESGLEWKETNVPLLGADGKLLSVS